MPAYIIWNGATNSAMQPLKNSFFVVWANSTAEAQALAASYNKNDSNKYIQTPTGTPGEFNINAFPIQSFFDFAGWRMQVVIYDADPIIDISVIATEDEYTLAEFVPLMVTALNADDQIANAAYDGPSQTLTIAGVADALGDKTFDLFLYPGMDEAFSPVEHDWRYDDPQPIPYGTYFENKSDQGLAVAPLTIEVPGIDFDPGWMNVVGQYGQGQGDY